MSDTEKQLREALSDVLAELDKFSLTDATKENARKVLAETEPKHAAVVAWEALSQENPDLVCGKSRDDRWVFLAGYKQGQLDTLPLVECDARPCGRITKQRIRDASIKVPTS